MGEVGGHNWFLLVRFVDSIFFFFDKIIDERVMWGTQLVFIGAVCRQYYTWRDNSMNGLNVKRGHRS